MFRSHFSPCNEQPVRHNHLHFGSDLAALDEGPLCGRPGLSVVDLAIMGFVAGDEPWQNPESWGACRRSGSIRIQRPDFLTLHHHCPLPFSAISPSVVGSLAGLGRPRSRSALLLLSPQRGPETNPDNESTTLVGGQNCISRPKLH